MSLNTPEQLTKMTKRIIGRASVQKCRGKQRERANRLEHGLCAPIHGNNVEDFASEKNSSRPESDECFGKAWQHFRIMQGCFGFTG